MAFFLLVGIAMAAYLAVYGGHVRLIMFIVGILLYEALQDGSIPAPRSRFALLALLGGLMATVLPFIGNGAAVVKELLLCWSFGIVCYTCFLHPDGALARGFSRTPLRWLGNMSYSYYLLHGLTLKAGFMVLFAAVPQVKYSTLAVIVAMPGMFALTLLSSACLFLLIERPFSLAPATRKSMVAGAVASHGA